MVHTISEIEKLLESDNLTVTEIIEINESKRTLEMLLNQIEILDNHISEIIRNASEITKKMFK